MPVISALISAVTMPPLLVFSSGKAAKRTLILHAIGESLETQHN